MLTARMVYRERPLTRVIFDRRGRVPPSARVFSTLVDGPVIMIEDDDLPAALQQLADRDIVSLLIEGGPTLQQAFFDADLVDRVQLVTTPHVLHQGVPGPQFGPRYIRRNVLQLGADTLEEFDVHRPD